MKNFKLLAKEQEIYNIFEDYKKRSEILKIQNEKGLIFENFMEELLSSFNSALQKVQIPKDLENTVTLLRKKLKAIIEDSFFDGKLYWGKFSKHITYEKNFISLLKATLSGNGYSQKDFFNNYILKIIPGFLNDDLKIDNRIDASFLFKSTKGELKQILLSHYSKILSDDGFEMYNQLLNPIFNINAKGLGNGELLLMISLKKASQGSDVRIGDKNLEVKVGVAKLGDTFMGGTARSVIESFFKSKNKDRLRFKEKINKNINDLNLKGKPDFKSIFTVNHSNFNALQQLIKNDEKLIELTAELYSLIMYNSVKKPFTKKIVSALSSNDFEELTVIFATSGLQIYHDKENWDSIIFLSKKDKNFKFITIAPSDIKNIPITVIDKGSLTSFTAGAGQAGNGIKLGIQ